MGGVYQLIATDVEGCLTPADRSATRLHSLDYIQRFCAGINRGEFPPLILVTGRNAPYCEKVIQDIGAMGQTFGIPSVIENGAVFYDHNRRNIHNYHPAIQGCLAAINQIKAFVDSLLNGVFQGHVIKEPGKEICISLNPLGFDIKELYAKVVAEFQKQGF